MYLKRAVAPTSQPLTMRTPKVPKRAKLGDIVQILTSEGVSYAQLTHIHPEYGHLIRIFENRYKKLPKDWAEVGRRPVQFSTFFPLQSAVNQLLVAVVANHPVPDELATFPTFRSRNGTRGGSIWIWDSGTSTKLRSISPGRRVLLARARDCKRAATCGAYRNWISPAGR